MSVLIWIQTIQHSDSVPVRIFLKKLSFFLKKKSQQTTTKNKESMNNYQSCKELNFGGSEQICADQTA